MKKGHFCQILVNKVTSWETWHELCDQILRKPTKTYEDSDKSITLKWETKYVKT